VEASDPPKRSTKKPEGTGESGPEKTRGRDRTTKGREHGTVRVGGDARGKEKKLTRVQVPVVSSEG